MHHFALVAQLVEQTSLKHESALVKDQNAGSKVWPLVRVQPEAIISIWELASYSQTKYHRNMEKVCGQCKISKDLTAFTFRNKKTDSRNTWCRTCMAAYDKVRHARRDVRHRKAKEQARRLEENQRGIIEHLKAHPCVDCGETDIVVLEYDHVRGKKRNNVSMMLGQNSWLTIQKEINKCEVRCANCHRRKTAKERNSKRFQLSVA
ncbi:hypothetical protein EKK58_00560 [Candidatus Dependentiae bacterium]|nr:MAG: hypothetical protein EKK58_00560 [Candidatus Dependentiae bacterium]